MFTKHFNFKVIISLLIFFGGIYSFTVRTKRNNVIRIGIGGEWKTLNPALQHTAYGDLVLSNQFDPLVGSYETGLPSPLGATAWTVSKDNTIFTFHIDEKRKFSDGSRLTATDYKRSWETSLTVDPKSFNKSTADVLYRIVGFEDTLKTGKISGVKVVSPTILRVHFKEPFRMALEYLSGVRYSAYKQVKNNEFIGTGKYVIRQLSEQHLELTPNPYESNTSELSKVFLSVVPAQSLEGALSKDEIDAWVHGDATKVAASVFKNKDVEILTGVEDAHQAISLNGLAHGFFFDPIMRLAFQSLILQLFEKDQRNNSSPSYFSLDPQVFLPLQPGRLEKQEVNDLIHRGDSHIPELIQKSKDRPLIVYYDKDMEWLLKDFQNSGVMTSSESKVIKPEERFNVYYKSTEYDVRIKNAFSVVSGDPDGIYHVLGKNGSILSPVTYRERVNTLLEAGRKIIGQEKLDEHYKNVSRAILTEVPFVHLGFVKAMTVFRGDRLKVTDIAQRRNEGHLDIFCWK